MPAIPCNWGIDPHLVRASQSSIATQGSVFLAISRYYLD